MKQNFSRRTWLNRMTAGMIGLLAAEELVGKPINYLETGNNFNVNKALMDPGDPIKITKLEIIPVNTLRTIFVKMYTDAGIVGMGEGTVEGRITTTMAAIKELEKYLIGKDP